MIERYTLPEMGKIWDEENKYRCWWIVEREVCRVQAGRGLIPAADLENIENKAAFSIDRILEIEADVKHDVIAFLTNIAEHVGESSRFVHKGMTSSDLLDTALALQLAQAGELLLQKLDGFIEILRKRADEHKDLLMIGRTHGVHAEPITFGLKFLIWKEEMQRHRRRLKGALEDVRVGKISGAVGTYQHLDPVVEQQVCERLHLTPAPVSNQIVQRDRHAAFVTAMALLATSIEKIAVEIRHLQRTEVLEAEEFFSKKQKGSSAMPHKRNPILSERLCGLARLLRGYAQTAMENVPLWHERDISHSSAERVILPDGCILLDFMLHDVSRVIENLKVYPHNIQSNLESTRGLIFSQEVLLTLVGKGVSREAAYQMVQRNAMQVWEDRKDFQELLLADREMGQYLSAEEIGEIFQYEKVLARIRGIFERIKKRDKS